MSKKSRETTGGVAKPMGLTKLLISYQEATSLSSPTANSGNLTLHAGKLTKTVSNLQRSDFQTKSGGALALRGTDGRERKKGGQTVGIVLGIFVHLLQWKIGHGSSGEPERRSVLLKGKTKSQSAGGVGRRQDLTTGSGDKGGTTSGSVFRRSHSMLLQLPLGAGISTDHRNLSLPEHVGAKEMTNLPGASTDCRQLRCGQWDWGRPPDLVCNQSLPISTHVNCFKYGAG